jgi:molybdenum cofactor biosynthesis enzyme MoaA
MTYKKPLCYAPFIGLYADYTGDYAPCCVSKKFKSKSLDDFWVGNSMKEMRKKLLNHEWPPECLHCKSRYNRNLESDMAVWNKTADMIDSLELNIETGNQQNSPLFLDFRPGNTCNLKCRMCGPKYSNQWESEIKANNSLSKWLSSTEMPKIKLHEFIEYSNKLNLIKVKILGGEPTIDENVLLFLENMISKKEKLPQLNITTNGTNLNKRFQNILKSFEKVQITFSIDAIDKEFDYVRTNASWKKVKKNIENVFEKNLATTYSFNTILMPYNIFSLKSLLEWYVELYNKNYQFSIFVDTSSASHTSLSAVLPEDVQKTIEEIKEYYKTVNSNFLKDVSGAQDFLNILTSVRHNRLDYEKFKEYNNLLDKVRLTNLKLLDRRFSKYV